MKRDLLLFGANGALGTAAASVFKENNFDKIYLFGSELETSSETNVENIIINDLSVEENVKQAFSSVNSSKDKIFFMFSTIGGFAGGKFLWDTETDEWDKMINKNLKTGFLTAKYFANLVKDSAGGAICFTAAYTGLHAESKKASYGVSKSGLIHLVRTLASEGREINLAINAIAPYIIDTPANRGWLKNADYSLWTKPEEIARLALSLFNNFNFISGNIIELKERFEIALK